MKLDSVEVFVVGNPPPGFGGRYFVFLKLKTACGIEGVGEVYAATFGPRVIAAMIEDVFARRFAGRDPFHIEAIWRESHGSGFTLRPEQAARTIQDYYRELASDEARNRLIVEDVRASMD